MRKLCSLAIALTVATVLYGLSTTPAHAYLDPATGSIILQILLGGAAGAALAARLYWHRLLIFLRIRADEPHHDHVDVSAEPVERQADR